MTVKKKFNFFNNQLYFFSDFFFQRDLKPENCLFAENGVIKLTDFGFATEFKTNETLTLFCGSENYQAPEIDDKIPYDGRKSDVYSLGVLLYVITTGFYPLDINGAYM